MSSYTSVLRTICICVPLVLTAACRDEQPDPVPPLPPPEVPQQPASPPSDGGGAAPPGSTSSSAPSAPASPSSATPVADAQSSEKLFATYCVSCHGTSGSGDGPLATTLEPRPRNFREGEFKFDTNADGKTGTVDDLANVIQNGAARYGGSPLMAGFPTLPKEQVRELAGYVHELSEESAGKGG